VLPVTVISADKATFHGWAWPITTLLRGRARTVPVSSTTSAVV